jgi:hypothetical protein
MIEIIFGSNLDFGSGIYFDEFCYVCDNITSELYFCIFDILYHMVPCAQNFIYMRNNFMDVLSRAGFDLPDEKILPPLFLQKSIRKISEYKGTIDKGNQKNKKK